MNIVGNWNFKRPFSSSRKVPKNPLKGQSAVSAGIVNLTTEGQIYPAMPSVSCTHRFLPNLKRLRAEEPAVNGLHQIAAHAEEVWCESVQREKPLSLSR